MRTFIFHYALSCQIGHISLVLHFLLVTFWLSDTVLMCRCETNHSFTIESNITRPNRASLVPADRRPGKVGDDKRDSRRIRSRRQDNLFVAAKRRPTVHKYVHAAHRRCRHVEWITVSPRWAVFMRNKLRTSAHIASPRAASVFQTSHAFWKASFHGTLAIFCNLSPTSHYFILSSVRNDIFPLCGIFTVELLRILATKSIQH